MADGIPSAFHLDDGPPPAHSFNSAAIGRGREYPNEIPAGRRCSIRIRVGVRWQQPAAHILFLHAIRVGCNIGTDILPTVFRGDIAHQLNLQPIKPFLGHVATFIGRHPGWWSQHELWLSIGPDYMPLNVWFPVELVSGSWQWRYGFPEWNILGMANVLNRRMLCATSEQVYAFERI
jgi:hypothetical protein